MDFALDLVTLIFYCLMLLVAAALAYGFVSSARKQSRGSVVVKDGLRSVEVKGYRDNVEIANEVMRRLREPQATRQDVR